jgi:uncharacterized protein (TIRG00374 family)
MTTEVKKINSVIAEYIQKNKSAIVLLIKILIAAGILIYLVSAADYRSIISGIEQADMLLVSIAFGLSILNIYLQYYKWRITCNTVLGEFKKSKILTSLFYGLSAGIITPLRVGEYFGRAIAFKDKSVLQVTGATLVDKFFPLLFVAFLGSIASILFIHFFYEPSVYVTVSLFVIVFVLFYFFTLLIMNEKFWDSIIFSRLRKSKRFNKLLEKIKVFKRLDRKYLAKMMLISFLFYCCFIFQYAILVMAFSHHNDFLHYLWAGNLLIYVKTIIPPVSFGELGIRESASVYFLSYMNESASVAFNASIFLFVINLLIPALVGLVLLLKRNDV